MHLDYFNLTYLIPTKEVLKFQSFEISRFSKVNVNLIFKPLLSLDVSEAHLETIRTSRVKIFSASRELLKVVNYFR